MARIPVETGGVAHGRETKGSGVAISGSEGDDRWRWATSVWQGRGGGNWRRATGDGRRGRHGRRSLSQIGLDGMPSFQDRTALSEGREGLV